MKMCEFLRSHADIAACSQILDARGLVHHGLTCKDWDLAHIVPDLGMGNLLDMGSSDSWLLANATMAGVKGLKMGIDLRAPDQLVQGCAFMIGDLMDTRLPPAFFESITCLSVIEHNVDFGALAAEVDRIVQPGGKIYLTFDYWEPKIVQTIRLYNMAWNILCRQEVEDLLSRFAARGIQPVDDVDWTIDQPVIGGHNWGPRGCIPYTFGLLTLKKTGNSTT